MEPGPAVSEVQHDDHCWMTACGENCQILLRRGNILYMLYTTPEGWPRYLEIDLSKIDFEEYAARCLQLLDERYPPPRRLARRRQIDL